MQFDQSTKSEGLSRLLALNAATGKTAWEVKRECLIHGQPRSLLESMARNRSSPVPTLGDCLQLSDGKEVWRAKCLQRDVGPSPVFANGIVYAAVEYEAASAIRANGKGDVTKTHILWKVKEDVPDLCSPLVAGPQFLFLTTFSRQADLLRCQQRQKTVGARSRG